MYKIIIADDEVRSRNFIINILKKRLKDFEIVAAFSDGSEVIEYLKSNTVDVVLCDIKMINVSGIEVAKWIYNNVPKIKVVFFSAYRDFSFATAAVKYNVVDYLNKPIRIPELLELFDELKKTLDVEHQELNIINSYKREIFKHLLSGFYSSNKHIDEAFANIHESKLTQCECGILTININNYKFDENFVENQFQNLANLSEQLNSVFYVKHTENSVVFIIFFTSPDLSSSKSVAKNLCNNAASLFNIEVSIHSLELFENIYELNKSIKPVVAETDGINLLEEKIIVALNSNDDLQMESLLDYLSNIYKDYSLEELKKAYSELIFKINETLFENGTADNDLQLLTKDLNNAPDTSSVNSLLAEYCSRISALQNRDDVCVQNILKIRDYVAEHCDQSLSLDEIAQMAHYTTTWFSRIFKTVTGQTYIDFLITCRINKSKQLLIDTDLKVNDIALAVGYPNTRSFLKTFKLRCSCSPSEYRRNHSGVDFNEKK